MACLKLARSGPGESFRAIHHGNVQTKAIAHCEIAARSRLSPRRDDRPAAGPYSVLQTILCSVDGLDAGVARDVADVIKNPGADPLEQLLGVGIGSPGGGRRDQQHKAASEREAHNNSLFPRRVNAISKDQRIPDSRCRLLTRAVQKGVSEP
jgi:hypothetical protein